MRTVDAWTTTGAGARADRLDVAFTRADSMAYGRERGGDTSEVTFTEYWVTHIASGIPYVLRLEAQVKSGTTGGTCVALQLIRLPERDHIVAGMTSSSEREASPAVGRVSEVRNVEVLDPLTGFSP